MHGAEALPEKLVRVRQRKLLLFNDLVVVLEIFHNANEVAATILKEVLLAFQKVRVSLRLRLNSHCLIYLSGRYINYFAIRLNSINSINQNIQKHIKKLTPFF